VLIVLSTTVFGFSGCGLGRAVIDGVALGISDTVSTALSGLLLGGVVDEED
jgi:hypothetical protein